MRRGDLFLVAGVVLFVLGLASFYVLYAVGVPSVGSHGRLGSRAASTRCLSSRERSTGSSSSPVSNPCLTITLEGRSVEAAAPIANLLAGLGIIMIVVGGGVRLYHALRKAREEFRRGLEGQA